jgi:predicted nucleotidyltransferase
MNFTKYSRTKELEARGVGYKVIYEVVVGSQAYGTNTPESDVDIKGVFIVDDLSRIVGDYPPQIELDKDTVFYEYSRFLHLLKSANPTVLEMLFAPKDTILVQDELMKSLINVRDKFVTQKCRHSFGGYGFAQIKKAKGLDKKMNYGKHFTEEKTIFDFCYIMIPANRYAPIPLRKYLMESQRKARDFGLVKLDHTRNLYSIYVGSNYRGIANEFVPVVSSVDKSAYPIGMMYWNMDAWQEYKKKHKEYLDWKKNRNTQRYIDTQKHGQKIDGKNLMHAARLVNVAVDIGNGRGMIVRRPEAQFLLNIRHGKMDLEEILDIVSKKIDSLDKIFDKNINLPYGVDDSLIKKLILNVYG